MATTTTPQLGLRVASTLTADAVFNLQRIDALASRFVMTADAATLVRSQTSVTIEPNAAALGGSGVGGVVNVGTASHALAAINLYGPVFGLSSIGLLDQAVGGNKNLLQRYVSSPLDTAANRTITWNVVGADRSLTFGGSYSQLGGSLALTLGGATALTLPTSGTLATLAGVEVFTGKSISGLTNTITDLTNTSIAAGAAIAYSKLNLAASIVNADVSPSAAIARSKIAAGTANQVVINDGAGLLSSTAALPASMGGTGVSGAATYPLSGIVLTDSNVVTVSGKSMSGSANTFSNVPYSALTLAGGIVNSDISPSAAIAYSKLALGSSIIGSDIAPGAAIALSKLAALGANTAVATNGLGVLVSSPTSATELSYLSGVTSTLQPQLDGKLNRTFSNSTLSGQANKDLLVATGPTTWGRLGLGPNGSTLQVVAGSPVWSLATSAGNVVGPTSSVDRTIAIFDGTTGQAIQGTPNVVGTDGSIGMPDRANLYLYEDETNGFRYVALRAPALIPTSYTITFPNVPGTSGQFLTTDGTGTTSWSNGPITTATGSWTSGTTFVFTHGLGTNDVVVSVYRKSDGATIGVDSMVRTSTNVVTLTSSEAPDVSGWGVIALSSGGMGGGGGGGSGSVTSVGLAVPGIFTAAGSPVTSSGTLSFSVNAQLANTIWAGPTSGGSATPSFRGLVPADLPITAAVGTWTTGLSFAFMHGLGTEDVSITVYEIDTGDTIIVDEMTRVDANNLLLSATQAPTGSGWKVVVQAAGATASAGVSSVNGQVGVVSLTTSDVPEGTGAYFTDERAQDAVASALTDTATIGWTYNDPAGTILASIVAGSLTNTHIAAGAAIAYTKLALGSSITNTDVSPSAAIAYSKLNLAGSILNADVATGAAIAYSKLNLTGSVVNADIAVGAAIAYAKLVLTNSIVNADVSATAAIAYSKLALTGSIVNTDVSASAAIAYSKLALTGSILNTDLAGSITYAKLILTGSIVDADIASAAAISLSKLAALGASLAVVTNPSGVLTTSATTAAELGFVSGVTSSIQTQINALQPSGAYITALTGDVTATGPGSVAATVAAVGGQTAASVAAATVLANAATSANTASAIVRRDASGNFSAGTITATLVGNATNVTGVVATANGGTGVVSTATFPTSGVVVTESGVQTLSNKTFVAPALGTPASGVLTNATGLPISTGVAGLATGMATFLGTATSANLAAAVTDETGTGALVFATSPTLVTPALGTPSSGVATNLTGLPLTTGVTGTLPIANGGTGQTTAPAAFGALSPLTTKGDLLGYSTLNARVPVGTNGQVLTADSTAALGVAWSTQPLIDFGDGSDGAVTISSNTTLTRDMYYSSLTVNATFTLSTAGFKIFVSGTLTNNGTISNNGTAGSAGVGTSSGAGGAGAVAGTLGGGGAGATTGAAAGAAGVAGTSVNPSIGGSGGAGGAGGTGGSGGAGGVATFTPLRTLTPHIIYGVTLLGGGAGGGSGGNGSTSGGTRGNGGGGGGGGGVLFVWARFLVNNGTIQSLGGAGGAGAASVGTGGNGGGGGGGGGGSVRLAYETITAGTLLATGGTGGAAGGNGGGPAGVAGTTGTTGGVVQYNALTRVWS